MEAGGQVHSAEQLGSSGEKPLEPVQCITLDVWLDLEAKEKETKPSKSNGHTIYKVPSSFISNASSKCYYDPKEVHLGPYNWSKNEKFMLERKRSMANKLISSQIIQNKLRSQINSNMEVLKATFCKDAAMDPEKWEEMLFLDGCFVLHFIFCIMFNRTGDLEMKRCHIDLVHNDLFLLENQLPFKLLEILSGNDPKLHPLIHEYICNHKLGTHLGEVLRREEVPPLHLLDCLRTIITGRGSESKKQSLGAGNNCTPHTTWSIWRRRLGWYPSSTSRQLPLSVTETPSSSQANKKWAALRLANKLATGGTHPTQLSSPSPWPASKKWTVLRHAKELTTRGIHLKPNRSGLVRDIFFNSHFIFGTLKLPRMVVDSSTRILFLNMAAYEMCASKLEPVIISYICFLDLLVNHAEDIKELQSAGILINKLSTDEDAAKLFNEMSEGLRPEMDAYSDVKKKMQKFFENKAKASLASWVAEGYHNHFRSPLTAMAVFAAFFVLCLTVVQTYYTIFDN